MGRSSVERHEARRVLGVPPGASDADVQRAFRHLARVHHPDRGGDPARLAAVVAARDRLLGEHRHAHENGAAPVVVVRRSVLRRLLDALRPFLPRPPRQRRDLR